MDKIKITGLILSFLVAHPVIAAPVEFGASLKAGEIYEKELGSGILFQMLPVDQGWTFSVVDAKQKSDLASGYNYPIRFNGTQYLDGSYGEDEGQARLGSERSVCFLNDPAKQGMYNSIITDMYWPSSYKAGRKAMSKLAQAPVGYVRVSILERHIRHKEHCVLEEGNCNITDKLRFRAIADVQPSSLPSDVACLKNFKSEK